MAHVTEIENQAAWLARGYVQGQRDLLLRLIEHRFSTPIPADVRQCIASASPVFIDSLSPLVLAAPSMDAVAEAADTLAADG
ncbi:MAG: hypothetical protein VX589_04000 [Myxococcota bacterium]|nr:hypothetical protein [Myxococcota bacterium]